MPTVYIVNKGGHNYDDAKRFGELVYLSEGEVSKFATSHMVRMFEPFIESSNAEDYILNTGLTLMSCIACSMFAKKHGVLNLLIFKISGYEVRKVQL